MLISLRRTDYFLKVTSLSEAENGLQTQGDQPEISGNMKALEEFLKTYKDMSEILESYKNLLQEDVIKIRSAGTTMITAEQFLLR